MQVPFQVEVCFAHALQASLYARQARLIRQSLPVLHTHTNMNLIVISDILTGEQIQILRSGTGI